MVLKSWWDEHRHWKYGPLTYEDGSKQFGVFTQMAWADSVHLGCGRSKFRSPRRTVIVCNYGPGGNIIGSTPYRAGEPTKLLYCVTGDCKRSYGDYCNDISDESYEAMIS
ncbi:unnamed protein product [Plutella xylostella]|uniref:(diamondback moth) hypothetical protein n=1 Tax=Plutella xylostella TaxID=51655 RepID=A0A8S4FZ47_PLUXY|nr:unnamed protein product [Plutella xylostella]